MAHSQNLLLAPSENSHLTDRFIMVAPPGLKTSLRERIFEKGCGVRGGCMEGLGSWRVSLQLDRIESRSGPPGDSLGSLTVLPEQN